MNLCTTTCGFPQLALKSDGWRNIAITLIEQNSQHDLGLKTTHF
jgi:hypothetical protein